MDTTIKTLGAATILSPLNISTFVEDSRRILYTVQTDYIEQCVASGEIPESFEPAGPRRHVYFDPRETICGIVTCGGLCPGLNNVIRSIVIEAVFNYGVKRVIGFQNGYAGLKLAPPAPPIDLTPERVRDIHTIGGTILSSSRGAQEPAEMVESLIRNNVNVLITIGGDGTLRGAHEIAREVERRGARISVIGIPKTIDNDISFVAKSFGFETAYSEAVHSIESAHVEATGMAGGIGLVKLMGRHSGFIAATAALAWQDVNFVLIPEVDFDLDGDRGLYATLRRRLHKRGHAVIVVAEGAGQKFFEGSASRDASGNAKLADIGLYLKAGLERYFAEAAMPVAVKYIDPSYLIRSVPANPVDSVFCSFLAQNAVHAAMAGKTDMLIGIWNNLVTHIPITLAISRRKQIDPSGRLWQSVLSATGQPALKN